MSNNLKCLRAKILVKRFSTFNLTLNSQRVWNCSSLSSSSSFFPAMIRNRSLCNLYRCCKLNWRNTLVWPTVTEYTSPLVEKVRVGLKLMPIDWVEFQPLSVRGLLAPTQWSRSWLTFPPWLATPPPFLLLPLPVAWAPVATPPDASSKLH